MPRLFYGHITIGQMRLTYYRTGGEKPPVILLHGFSDNALCWNRVPLALEEEFDVILPDARGHGSSGIGPEGVGLEVQARDVEVLIETLALKPPVVIGHSMGADVAARLAANRPDLVRGLVLEDPPWGDHLLLNRLDPQSPQYAQIWDDLLINKQRTLDDLIALCRTRHPTWDESEYFQWAKAKRELRPEALSGWVEPRRPWREVVCSLRCPGLLLTADPAHGGLITPQVAQEIKALWPQVQVVPFPEVGHSIHREAYRPYIQTVLRFLRKVSG
ncbi:alpha/beta hydrolase [uncultured Thermanaerothrix sp.]|uniref:alpha/beta fold hydrolase n=1 Tax=uncultured Thermanaerothrix sp. TaxID=1195149 RepID=UPI0026372A59|nr:alpha/beta hydrolase [uncultured Thermanaerothrix sp.]